MDLPNKNPEVGTTLYISYTVIIIIIKIQGLPSGVAKSDIHAPQGFRHMIHLFAVLSPVLDNIKMANSSLHSANLPQRTDLLP